jgi:hypothetical protein
VVVLVEPRVAGVFLVGEAVTYPVAGIAVAIVDEVEGASIPTRKTRTRHLSRRTKAIALPLRFKRA